ncbi:WYL domain-containing protein [Niallia sp. 03133]|uniref:WYL domain-containing protein n=1 Tax=Niallia sp. 03133 TaxID=3458060 RepID=UPI0040444223
MNRQLEKALLENLALEIIYEKNDKTFSKRTILINDIQANYIKAYCLTKRQPRIFKIESILAASFVTKNYKMYA